MRPAAPVGALARRTPAPPHPSAKPAYRRCGCGELHQQVFTGVVAAQDDVVDLADVHQLRAAAGS